MVSGHSGPEEARRVAGLVAAQEKAVALFAEAERRGLVAPGVGEREASDRIRDLANVLELHFVDRARGFGGFYEQLLDLA
ncbi:hypothetical protein AB0M44_15440 [Streptosporangium subroseum]|uniref:hypothetical protein n=1 Tax=Streptosporangium subroseum TaxID=106412 RepID=UPI003435FA8E